MGQIHCGTQGFQTIPPEIVLEKITRRRFREVAFNLITSCIHDLVRQHGSYTRILHLCNNAQTVLASTERLKLLALRAIKTICELRYFASYQEVNWICQFHETGNACGRAMHLDQNLSAPSDMRRYSFCIPDVCRLPPGSLQPKKIRSYEEFPTISMLLTEMHLRPPKLQLKSRPKRPTSPI